ncbi:MAG: DUF3006 domain-containing protein [Gemmatimonadales bacterium]
MATEHLYFVDQIEAGKAVLVDDTGRATSVPLDQLPDGLEERVVLRAAVDESHGVDWASATVDIEETERRKRASGALLEKLRETDEYGFITPPE